MNNTCDIYNILNIFIKRYRTSLEMALYKLSIIIIIIIIIIITTAPVINMDYKKNK